MPHCDEQTCDPNGSRCRSTVHAEVNAIIKAGFRQGATLYVTHMPCKDCAKVVVNSGVMRVMYDHLYGNSEGLDLMLAAGIIVRPIR